MQDIKELMGKDSIKGKPIRLNRVRLELKKKDYAEILLFGDLHLGHPNCDLDRAKANLEYCLNNKVYVLLMGDLLESGLRSSVGDSVYEQKLNPHKQYEECEELLRPLAEAELIIGVHIGNHEARILKETSINLIKIICKSLKVPYLGSACWTLAYVGDQSYNIYSMHGTTGSKFIYTKLKAIVDVSHNFMSDIIAMGHTHDTITEPTYVQKVDKQRKMVVEHKKYHILTGHYLKYDGSYAQDKGYSIGKMGSPKVKLFSGRHDIHAST